MYYNPREVIPLLREEYTDFLCNLGSSPNPWRRRDLALAMWVLAWDLDDWDSLSYDWQANLFYFGQTITMARVDTMHPRGKDMTQFCCDYIEELWCRKTRYYVGKRVFCSPREMYWQALHFLPGHDYYDAMWTLLEKGIVVTDV